MVFLEVNPSLHEDIPARDVGIYNTSIDSDKNYVN